MRRDFHMHPQVLTRPERFEAFVARALELGIGEICVTDHMPLSFIERGDRIPKGQVGAYCARVRQLADLYADRLRIRCGIEIDYHPEYLGEIEEVLGAGEFDYVLGSSHMHLFYDRQKGYTYSEFAALALENLCRAAQTGYFSALAHTDMYRWVFLQHERFPLRESEYAWQMHADLLDEIFRLAAAKGIYIEINTHFAEKRDDLAAAYPEPELAARAAAMGVRFAYGSDAHRPESVGALLSKAEQHPVYGPLIAEWEK